MTAATNYTEDAHINAMLRGVAYPLPTGTFVSLHTGDPGETGAANEVTTLEWPSYVRRHAEAGGSIGSGWSAPVDGVSSNLNQMTFPSNNGPSPVTVEYFVVWDAASGGNARVKSPLTTPRIIDPLEVPVFDVGTLVIAQT